MPQKRLDEILEIAPATARVTLAEVGVDPATFPTAGPVVSWTPPGGIG